MKTIEFMSLKVSDLIAELTEIQGTFGDIDCFALKAGTEGYLDLSPLDFIVMDSADGQLALAFVDAVTASEMDIGDDEGEKGPGPGDTLQ